MENIRILHQYEENNKTYIIAESTAEGSCCPSCGILSKARHSKYTRKLFNGTLEGSFQEIFVIVRKFKCKAKECSQKIFTERISFAKAYCRFTNNVMDLIKLLALSASAERVSIILSRLGISISHDSILRFLRKLPHDAVSIDESVINIGVDDFAFKKSKKYCTLICDMDKKTILDILPSRNKDVVSTWLKKYPHVKLVSRDGSTSYGGAISDALPEAVQVSDKFHLIKNLLDSVSKYIRRKYPRTLIISDNSEDISDPINETDDKKEKNKPAITISEEKVAKKCALIKEIKEKNSNGISIRELARIYHMSRNTIKSYLIIEESTYRPYGMRKSELDEYRDVIINLASNNGTHQFILDEIRKLGYTGKSRSNLASYMSKNGIKKSSVDSLGRIIPKKDIKDTVYQGSVIKAICKNTSNLTENDLKVLDNLRVKYPELLLLNELIDEFKNLFRNSPQSIEQWLTKAKEFKINEINSFVCGIERDILSVKNSMSGSYTNGLLEGMVNKVKGIKRTSYGRCKFDLLRTKVLNSQAITG